LKDNPLKIRIRHDEAAHVPISSLFNPYPWIIQAIRKRLQLDQIDFLANSCPGSGKTGFGVLAGAQDLNAKIVDYILVVSPSATVNDQWIKKFKKFANIPIIGTEKNPWRPDTRTGKFQIPDGFRGAVLTYSALASNAEEVREFIENHNVLVIFDEVHHLGEDLTWGKKAREAFDKAKRRLLLTGTAFRGDDVEIPFVQYVLNAEGYKVCKTDFDYTYREAVRDKICRAMAFPDFTGRGKYKYDGKVYDYNYKDEVGDQQARRRLRASLAASENFIKTMIEDANDRLTFVRKTQPDAAGLVVAMNIKHARDIISILEDLGESPILVVSTDPSGSIDKKSKAALDAFAESNSRWVVSVNMVTEGVDIPRFRVGVYASNVTAWLRFLQIIGRFGRHQQDIPYENEMSWIYIPKDPILYEYANSILEDVEVALEERKKQTEPGLEDMPGPEKKKLETLEANGEHDETTVASIKNNGEAGMDKFTADEISRAKDIIVQLNLPTTPEKLAAAMRVNSNGTNTVILSGKLSKDDLPDAYRCDKLRKDCGKKVRQLVIARNGDTNNFDDWKKWTSRIELEWQGKGKGYPDVKNSSVADLEAKLKWLQGELRATKKDE